MSLLIPNWCPLPLSSPPWCFFCFETWVEKKTSPFPTFLGRKFRTLFSLHFFFFFVQREFEMFEKISQFLNEMKYQVSWKKSFKIVSCQRRAAPGGSVCFLLFQIFSTSLNILSTLILSLSSISSLVYPHLFYNSVYLKTLYL